MQTDYISHHYAIGMVPIDIHSGFRDMEHIDFYKDVNDRKNVRERRKNELNRELDSMDEILAMNADDCYMVGNSNTLNTGATTTMLGNTISTAGR